MKSYYLPIILILFSIQGYSQFSKDINAYKAKYGSMNQAQKFSTGLSPSTAILLQKLTNEKAANKDSLLEGYHVIKKDRKHYVKVFLISKSNSNLSKQGFIESRKFGKIRTGIVELTKVEDLIQLDEVTYVEIATEVQPLLNEALLASNVDKAHTGASSLPQSYTGDGVVVGVIDVGFDYTHPSFYDSTGAIYRIKRVWEQSSLVGIPPTGYAYGRELSTQSTILAAQTDNNAESHGSHVAGTAAGSGAGTGDLYRGVAFESDVVLVSTDFTNLGIAEGVDYIIKYANSVNKPCVINMSLGSHVGPHDGMSALDQVFDSLSGNGKILVGAAGNEGSDSIYIGKSYSGNDTVIVSYMNFPSSNLGTNGTGLIDIWGEPNDNFKVAVNIYNTNTDQIEDFTPYITSSSSGSFNYTIQDNDIFSDDCIVDIATEINPMNNKPHITIEVDHTDQDDDYRWVLVEIIGHNTSTKMWATGSYFTSNGYNSPFEQGSTSSTIGEIGGTSNNIITVGAYTTKNSYVNINSSQETIPFNVQVEEIAPFSSKGPTADNRTKPDITAPGNVIVAPVNSFDPNYATTNSEVVYGVTDGTSNWYYGAMQGTSMASPMVTGVLALWLEANSNLSPTNIKNILKNHSRTDSYTGSIPASGNNTWGWGKIDALAGLVNIVGIGENSFNNSSLLVYPNPSSGTLFIDASELEGVSVRISNLMGQIVKEETVLSQSLNQLNVENLQNGMYLLLFEKDGQSYSHKLIIEK